MFSLFTKETTEKNTNNPLIIELGKVSEKTLGSFGAMPEALRATRMGWDKE